MSDKIKIGLTVCESRFENYRDWIKGGNDNIEIVELSAEKQNWDEIEDCDGIVLTGGVDVHPEYYESNQIDYPGRPDEFNRERDEFEMHVFETALNFDHPILAICRGMQLVNVSLGGDLVQDLVSSSKNDHTRISKEEDRTHEVSITPGTLLADVAALQTGKINSSHHQALGRLSDELTVNAVSPDGVPEGAEWARKEGKSWLLAVQWHPERMTDRNENPLSKNIRERFLQEVKKTITH